MGFPLHCHIAMLDDNVSCAGFDVRGASGPPIALMYQEEIAFALLCCFYFASTSRVWFCQVRLSMSELSPGLPPPWCISTGGSIFTIILLPFCLDNARVVLSSAVFDVSVASGFSTALAYK